MKLTQHIRHLADGIRTPREIAAIVNTTERYVRSFMARERLQHLIPASARPKTSGGGKPNPWNDPAVTDRLRELVTARVGSGARIAEILNQEFSIQVNRAATIGKMFRMGLSNPSGQNRSATQTKVRERAKPKPIIGLPDLKPEPIVRRADLPPAVARKPLVKLLRDDCRWPVGDPGDADFGFCALPRVPGKPYCEICCQRAYNPPQVRAKATERELV